MPESVDPSRLKLTNDAGTEGVLVGFRCRQCGIYVFGAATFCQSCASANLTRTQVTATIVGDLTTGVGVPSEAFDCIILTQTLCVIYDIHSAVRHVHRALKPGGVVLATVPGISQICRRDYDRWGDYWRFTTLSARKLFAEVFGPENVHVEAHGNVLTAMAFMNNLAIHELSRQELDHVDPDYELNIAIRAVKEQA
jgi:SAM-dependent methyltransferase